MSSKSGLDLGQMNRNNQAKIMCIGLTSITGLQLPGCVKEGHTSEEELSSTSVMGLVTRKRKVFLG